MSRILTEHYMERRRAMAEAKSLITDTMADLTKQSGGLSVFEWTSILLELIQRLTHDGLEDEWKEDTFYGKGRLRPNGIGGSQD